MRVHAIALILASILNIATSAPLQKRHRESRLKRDVASTNADGSADSSQLLEHSDSHPSDSKAWIPYVATAIPVALATVTTGAVFWKWYKVAQAREALQALQAKELKSQTAQNLKAWKAYDDDILTAIDKKYQLLKEDVQKRFEGQELTAAMKEKIAIYEQRLVVLRTDEATDYVIRSAQMSEQGLAPPLETSVAYLGDHAAALYAKHPEILKVHFDEMAPQLAEQGIFYDWAEQHVTNKLTSLIETKIRANPNLRSLRDDSRAAERESSRLRIKWANAIDPTTGFKNSLAMADPLSLSEFDRSVPTADLKQVLDADYFPKLKLKESLPENFREAWQEYDAMRIGRINQKYDAIRADFEFRYPNVDSSKFLDVLLDQKWKDYNAYWGESSLRADAEQLAGDVYLSDQVDNVFIDSEAARQAVVEGLKNKLDAYTAASAKRDVTLPNFLTTTEYNDLCRSVDKQVSLKVTEAVSADASVNDIWQASLKRDSSGLMTPIDAAVEPVNMSEAFKVPDDTVKVPSNSELDFDLQAGTVQKADQAALDDLMEEGGRINPIYTDIEKLVIDDHFGKSAAEGLEKFAQALSHSAG